MFLFFNKYCLKCEIACNVFISNLMFYIKHRCCSLLYLNNKNNLKTYFDILLKFENQFERFSTEDKILQYSAFES